MARIDPISPDDATGQTAEAFDEIMLGLGRISNMYRTAGHSPTAVKDLYRLGRHFLVEDEVESVDYTLMRMVHLRISDLNGCNYCATHNAVWSTKVGVSPEKLDAVISPEFSSSDLLSDEEKAALRWADAVTANTAKVDEAAFAELQRFFNQQQIVELTLAIAYRNMVNRFVDALQVDVEEEAIAACPISVTTG